MALGVPTGTLLVVAGIVASWALTRGVAGFGYGVASTAILATVLSPATAVVVVILPALAANASLLGELDREGLRSCAERSGPTSARRSSVLSSGWRSSGPSPRPTRARARDPQARVRAPETVVRRASGVLRGVSSVR
jgi:hypothetical protein